MKINLLTMHYSLSIGATLQTYATCRILEKMGHEVTIINFKDKVELKRRKSIKYWLSSGTTKILFELFKQKHFPKRTKEIFHIDYEKLPKADLYISGSDQIWNPHIVDENLPVYMFNFIPDNIKRISYASSFGVNKWEQDSETTQQVQNLLSKFSHLAVREDTGVKFCTDIFKLNAKQVLDPTLLIDDYSNLIGNIRLKDEIVCFKLSLNNDFYDSVAYIRGILKIKTALLHTLIPSRKFDKNYFSLFESPIKWMRRIASAKLVITDSFHGLAFSIIFKKNFIVLAGEKNKTTRLLSLLNTLGLNERYFDSYESLRKNKNILVSDIDYNNVNSILEEKKKESLQYLRNSIIK
ncbi:MAG: polysaccharide pyruvyl transferase family protein [Muribaculaceae bacterium]|nr:polysaccharide pyruvyl transferase family protein [Muribaculaceae bacterium]